MSATKSSFQPSLEVLESREVPAIISLELTNGALTIKCDRADDYVGVHQNWHQIEIHDYVSRRDWNVPANQVRGVIFRGRAGDDTFWITAYRPTKVDGGSGNDKLYGGESVDQLFGGYGNDKLYGNGGDDILHGDHPALTPVRGVKNNDFLSGGTGRDQFFGELGFDRYQDDFNLAQPLINFANSDDVRQGQSNTCQINAVMAGLARHNDITGSDIWYVGANYYDVWMYNNGAYRERVFFDGTWTDQDSQPLDWQSYGTRKFWNVLYQRAYLQSYDIDWTRHKSTWDDVTKQWQKPVNALHRLTGRYSSWTRIGDARPEDMWDQFIEYGVMVFGTKNEGTNNNIAPWHAYTVINIYKAGSTWYVYLRNPWAKDGPDDTKAQGYDDGHLILTWSQFRTNFKGYAVA